MAQSRVIDLVSLTKKIEKAGSVALVKTQNKVASVTKEILTGQLGQSASLSKRSRPALGSLIRIDKATVTGNPARVFSTDPWVAARINPSLQMQNGWVFLPDKNFSQIKPFRLKSLPGNERAVPARLHKAGPVVFRSPKRGDRYSKESAINVFVRLPSGTHIAAKGRYAGKKRDLLERVGRFFKLDKRLRLIDPLKTFGGVIKYQLPTILSRFIKIEVSHINPNKAVK